MCAQGAGPAQRWDAGGDARARQGGGGLAVRLRQLFYETSKTAHISCRFLASVEGLVFPRGEAFSGAFSSKERRLGPPFGSPASSRESIDGAFVLFWRGGLGAERPRRSAPRFPAKLRVVLSSRGAGRRDSLCFESVPRSRTRPLQFLSRSKESATNMAQSGSWAVIGLRGPWAASWAPPCQRRLREECKATAPQRRPSRKAAAHRQQLASRRVVGGSELLRRRTGEAGGK